MTDEHDHAAHDHDHDHHHEHTLAYPDAVAQFRADKDAYFQGSPHSPIPAVEREAFTGLPYFPVDERLYFDDLRLQAYEGAEPTSFQIPTSDNQLRPAKRAGVLRFE